MNYPAYRMLRTQGIPANLAVQCLRHRSIDPPLVWNQGIACWEQDGFGLCARLISEPYPDLSYLGAFTNRWQPSALAHDRANPRTLDWFVPGITEKQHYQALRQMKCGRARARELAHRYVREDYRRACQHGIDWALCVLTVHARQEGVELGRACLGGVESDASEACLTELAQELATEAMVEARQNLDRLCCRQVA